MRNVTIIEIAAILVVIGPVLLPSTRTFAESSRQKGQFAISPVIKKGDAIPGGHQFLDSKFCDGFMAGDHALNDLAKF